MNTPTAAHLCIYGIVFAVMAVISASLVTAQVHQDEPTVSQQEAEVHIAPADEPEQPAEQIGAERRDSVEADTMNAPAAPTGLQAAAGDTKAILFWNDPGDSSITEYEYQQKFRSGGSYGNWTTIFASGATTTHFLLGSLTNGELYGFKIRARAGSVAGTASSEVTVTTAADNTAPTVGTLSYSVEGSTLHGGVHYLNTGNTVTLSVPVTDQNPPRTKPTLTVKFGASGTERTLTAGTTTLAYSSPGTVTTYTYSYTLQNSDVGTMRHKITGVTDTAPTPNTLTDPTSFTEITALNALTPVTNIGIQAASDSGVDDDITNDTTAPVIEFTTTANATISGKYRKSGESSWVSAGVTGTVTGTSGTVTLPNLTGGDGDYEVEITQQAPSAQARATLYTFTLDTTSPDVFINDGVFTNKTPLKIGFDGDVTVSSLSRGDSFGSSTSLSADGTLLAVGASSADNSKGAAYLFEKSDNTWSQTLKIFDKVGSAGAGEIDITLDQTVQRASGSSFGFGIALSDEGTLLAVGAIGDDSGKGAVYLFEKINGTWSQSLKISDNSGGTGELDVPMTGTNFFGSQIDFSSDGTLLAIGAYGQNFYKGAVYLFEKSGGTWSQSLKISDNSGGTGELDIPLSAYDLFGNGVTISGDGTLLAASAYGQNSYKGAVYLFEKSGGTWSQSLKISDNNGGAGELDVPLTASDYFGKGVALSADGTLLAVGTYGDGDGAENSGAVYIFKKQNNIWTQILKISNNDDGIGKLSVTLAEDNFFGYSTSLSNDNTVFAVGATGVGESTGAVYLFSDTATTRTAIISATDGEPHGSTWEYMTTTGSSCGAAQFATTQTAYTEGGKISFSTEADNGKRVCFKTTDTAGNAAAYTLSDTIKTIDRSTPVLSATRIGTGNSRTYRVRATDVSSVTGRTKDNVVTGSCTTSTTTTGAGWSDYTPGEIVGTAHNTNGRCVIITDALGHKAKIHLLDSASVPQDFTLDLDGSGTYEPNKDAILLYLYSNQGASASELTTFTAAGTQLAVTSAIGKINAVKDSTNTPMDMDGNGTFTANTDGAIPYLHSGQGYDATALVPFTYNRQQTTATNAITTVRGAVTPDWP